MGESIAVASAKRAALGDLRDGGLTEGAYESSDDARGRAVIVTVGAFFRDSDISLDGCRCLIAVRLTREDRDFYPGKERGQLFIMSCEISCKAQNYEVCTGSSHRPAVCEGRNLLETWA